MTVRRLQSLVSGLPTDSALRRAVDPNWHWSTTDELLACLIEVNDRNGVWFYQANSKKGTKSPKPVHVPRPWDETDEPTPAQSDEMKAFFGKANR